MLAASAVMVGMSEVAVLKGQGQFHCPGLGSCLALCAFDPMANVAGCVHIMLPEAFKNGTLDKPGKFADTGLEALLKAVESIGGDRKRLKLATAGGAQVFKFGGREGSTLDIGARNAAKLQELIKEQGLRLVAIDTGGNLGRTVTYTVDTGIIQVRTLTQGEKTLCNLRS